MAVSVVDPDAILVQEHLGGERDAFDVLYRRYFPRLVRLCTRLTKDGATAEDIAQETLVRAHDHLERFDLGRPMWPWLKTIATRVLIDHTRASGREVPTEERPIESSHVEHGWTEERDVLVQALSKLPPRQRTAVALRYIEDWDAPQVAEHLGLSGLAFRQILHRARRKLQTEYRKIAEPVMGAILVPVAWIRRMGHEASSRARHFNAGPDPLKVVSAAVAVNLVVAATAIFGGAGHDAPPSVERSAPPNNIAELPGSGGATTEKDRVREARSPAVSVPQPQEAATSRTDATGTADDGLPSKVQDRSEALASDVVDPNSQVHQPEDAQVQSVVYAPRFPAEPTIYAAGVGAACKTPQCPPVLFQSTDAGASWVRLTAAGLHGTQLLLPPAYGLGDDRIFATGPFGLEVSEDQGASFHPAAAGSPAFGAGSAAISPGFNSGDPTILMGDQSLMQYRDDVKAVGPTRPVPGRGPLHPVFSPTYEGDRILMVGGLQVDPRGAEWAPAVFRCSGEVCTGSPLPTRITESPRVRPAPDFGQTGKVYAFTAGGLFVSIDKGETFSRLQVPWQHFLHDVAVAEGGRVFAAVRGDTPEPTGQLYSSANGGVTWTLADNPLLNAGASTVRVSGNHVLVGLHFGGIACSADGGVTWATRCPAAAPSGDSDAPSGTGQPIRAPLSRAG
jgi:RNA polymerase sigma-70 factor, ECF subfamily